MARITPQQAGGVNVVAFLDMLAWESRFPMWETGAPQAPTICIS